MLFPWHPENNAVCTSANLEQEIHANEQHKKKSFARMGSIVCTIAVYDGTNEKRNRNFTYTSYANRRTHTVTHSAVSCMQCTWMSMSRAWTNKETARAIHIICTLTAVHRMFLVVPVPTVEFLFWANEYSPEHLLRMIAGHFIQLSHGIIRPFMNIMIII